MNLKDILDKYRIPNDNRFIEILIAKYINRGILENKRSISPSEQRLFTDFLNAESQGLQKIIVVYGGKNYKFSKDDQIIGIFNDSIEDVRSVQHIFDNSEKHWLKLRVERLYGFLTRYIKVSGITIIEKKKGSDLEASISKSRIKQLVYDLLSPGLFPEPKKKQKDFDPNKYKVSKINSILR